MACKQAAGGFARGGKPAATGSGHRLVFDDQPSRRPRWRKLFRQGGNVPPIASRDGTKADCPRFDICPCVAASSSITQGCPTSGAEISRQAGVTGGAMTLEPDPGHAGGGTGRRHGTPSLSLACSSTK